MQQFRRILGFANPLKKYYIGISLLTLLIAGLAQVTPFLIKAIIDQIVAQLSSGGGSVGVEVVVWPLIGIVIVELSTNLIDNIKGYWGDLLSAKLNRLLSIRYYQHLLRLPQSYFDQQLSGKLISKLQRGISELSNFVNAMSNNFMQFAATALVTLTIISFYSPVIALLLLFLFPFYAWLTRLSSKSWKQSQDIINQHSDTATGRFNEVMTHIPVVRAFIQERRELTLFKDETDAAVSETYVQSRLWHKYDILRRAGVAVVLVASYGIITVRALNGDLTIGEFTLLLQLIAQARQPLFAMSFIVDRLQRAEANSKDYFEVMDVDPSESIQKDSRVELIDDTRIEFKKVDFGYGNESTVISDISFTIEQGKKLALVGESGQGKSTIANLLMKLYEPDSGTITIGNKSIDEYEAKRVRGNIGVVFQDAGLFSGTIRDNIAYANPGATDDEVKAAAKAANAAGFIEKLSDGYDSQIGERGIRLSGGQQQRISIARAILKNPPLLILDEATSSLDSKAEAEVQTALDRLMEGRTSLIIAHRLSTIQHVDQIVVLENGTVLESGSPAELRKSDGLYAELLALQDPTTDNTERLKKYDISAN